MLYMGGGGETLQLERDKSGRTVQGHHELQETENTQPTNTKMMRVCMYVTEIKM